MSTDLANSPVELELRRLARLLHTDVDALAGLEAMPVEDLRTLRGQIAAALFDHGADSWERAAAVSGVVPAGLAAKLAQGALGPVLAARVTSQVDVDRAVEISTRLPPEFMADTAINIDPRQVTDLVSHLPPATIADVGQVLAERGEWLVMADFVAAVDREALRATVDALDEHALLRTAVLLEDPGRIEEVVAMLDADRLARVREVARSHGLTGHLTFIAQACGPGQRRRLAG
jgi:hypothetical protein